MSDADPSITYTRMAAWTFPTNAEIEGFIIPDLFNAMLRTPTPEEAQAVEERRKAKHAAATERHDAARAELRDLGTPATARLLRLVDMHSPDEYGYCRGCDDDRGGMSWPCSQWLIATGQEDA